MKAKFPFLFSLTLLVTLLSTPIFGQQDLPENHRAVAAFEVRLDQLRESEFAKAAKLDSQIQQWMESEHVPAEYSPESISRITGVLGLPDDLGQLFQLREDDSELPLHFHVELEFSDADGLDTMFAESVFTKDNEFAENGKTFHRIDGFGPPNLAFRRMSPTKMRFGTLSYLRQDQSVFSEQLTRIWSETKPAPIRAAVDSVSRVDFIRQAMEFAKQQSPDAFHSIIDVVDNSDSIRLAIDPDSSHLVQLTATGIDEDNAMELRGVLDGLLGMAKFSMAAEMESFERHNPQMAQIGKQVMNDLRATGEGLEVNINIRMQKDLDTLIASSLFSARREARDITKLNRIRQVLLSMHNFHDARKRLPFSIKENDFAHESLSWRLLVLPYLEANYLYDELELSEPWDSDANILLATQMPEMFGTGQENTDIAFIRPDDCPSSFADIRDGLSNTVALIEYPAGLPWTQNNDLSIDDAVELVRSLNEGEKLAIGYYDGSVTYVREGIGEDLLRKILDPNDGEVIDDEELSRWTGR